MSVGVQKNIFSTHVSIICPALATYVYILCPVRVGPMCGKFAPLVPGPSSLLLLCGPRRFPPRGWRTLLALYCRVGSHSTP